MASSKKQPGYNRRKARRFLVAKMHELGEHPDKQNTTSREIVAFAASHPELIPDGVSLPERRKDHKKFLYELGKRIEAPVPRQSESELTSYEQKVRRDRREARAWMRAFHKNEKEKKRKEWESFYKSKEWRVARYEAIRRYGGKCMACGASPSDGRTILHVDHIKPRSKYPELELDVDNLQVLCEDCNVGKSDKYNDDWR